MSNHVYKVLISAEASDLLGQHIAFLAKVSIGTAKVLRNDLLARIKNLGKGPHLYPVFYSSSLGTEYRKLVYKRYLILYSIDEYEKIVRIKYIWDSRKNNKI